MWNKQILAADISRKVLEHAQRGVYSKDSLAILPAQWRMRHFSNKDTAVAISDNIRDEVIFRMMNLHFNMCNPPFTERSRIDMPYAQRSGNIKVLVVDDSFVYREFMMMGLSADPSIQVVATAENPFEARDKILQWAPDVMICDIEMPLMNGIEFISRLLPQYPIPVIVVSTVHIPAVFSRIFAERLNDTLPLSVKEAQPGDFIIPGQVLIAPGDRHMEVKRWGQHLQVECYTGERVNGHCPSIDVMFESVAAAVGKQAVGVLLTGMGSDGAKGLLAMRKQGARTVGQDERTSVVYGMPKAAYEIGAVERQIGLSQIPGALLQLLAEKE